MLTEQYKRHSLAMSRVNNTNVTATTDSMLNDSMAQPSIWHTQPHISTTHCYSTIMHILQHNSVQGSTKTHMAAQQGICKSSKMYTSKHNIAHVKAKQRTCQSNMSKQNNAHVKTTCQSTTTHMAKHIKAHGKSEQCTCRSSTNR